MLTRSLRWVLKFAVAELRHERLFALGVSMAVCSVMTPTMLLWGVKNGLVTSLRKRLAEDPRARELRGRETVNIPREWFDSTRRRPDTEFCIPSVRQISLAGNMRQAPGGPVLKLDELRPTAPGDPLGDDPELDWSTKALPVPCMLSAEAADKLHVAEGGTAVLEVTRSPRGKPEKSQLPVQVRKIIPLKFIATTALFLPRAVIEGIENYKDGQEVAALGWKADTETSHRRYSGCLISYKRGDEPSTVIDRLKDRFQTANVARPPPEQLAGLLKTPPPADRTFFTVEFTEPEIDQEKFEGLLRDAGSKVAGMLPYMREVTARQQPPEGGVPKSTILRTSADKDLSISEARDLFSKLQPRKPGPGGLMLNVLVESDKAASGLVLILPQAPGQIVGLSPAQAGIVGAALQRTLHYQEAEGTLAFERKYYGGFRLYARTIDDVAALRRHCEESGIRVETQEASIQQVKTLDESLSRLISLIAGLSVLGGFGALFASLYLSVERGRRQLSVLRVLGIPPATMLCSILLQSVLLICFGTSLATALYLAGARVLQAHFGSLLQKDEVFCQLSTPQMGMIGALGILAGLLAGFLASLRLRNMDAAAVARAE